MIIVKYVITFYDYTEERRGMYLISYEPFWRTLKERGMTTYTLIKNHNISSATIDRIRKGGGISTLKIDDFCRILDCRVEDILLYLPDEN